VRAASTVDAERAYIEALPERAIFLWMKVRRGLVRPTEPVDEED
jgi:hypothetical protein